MINSNRNSQVINASNDSQGRSAAIEVIRLIAPKCVLDVGIGTGIYGQLLRQHFPSVRIFGLEIWAPYVTHAINHLYDQVFISDMQCFDYSLIDIDLIIAAHVLEHVGKNEATYVVDVWKRFANRIVAVLPLGESKQGPANGNEFEAHHHQWQADEIERDLGLTFIVNCGACGVFEWIK